jgi:hypothetical protein
MTDKLFVWADALFDLAKEHGAPPLAFGILDKRVLLPFDELLDAVARESKQVTSPEKLREYVDAGLFPLLPREGDAGDLGFPLYVPSRIGLLAELEQQGWTQPELQRVAELEEMTIDFVLTSEELAYEDDDAKLVNVNVEEDIRRDEEFLKYLEADPRPSGPPPRYEPEATPAQIRARMGMARTYLEKLRVGALSPAGRERMARVAYRVRARDEWIRHSLLEHDRAKLRAGFSPWIIFSGEGWDEHNAFSPNGIDWSFTVREPALGENDEPLPIRLPGIVIRDEQLALTKVSTPREYERLWREYQLEDYFRERAKVREERICQHCLKSFPEGTKPTKLYCSDNCRGAAKMQRFRQNSPDKHLRIQERYWTDEE